MKICDRELYLFLKVWWCKIRSMIFKAQLKIETKDRNQNVYTHI